MQYMERKQSIWYARHAHARGKSHIWSQNFHIANILRTAKACVTVSRLRECPNRPKGEYRACDLLKSHGVQGAILAGGGFGHPRKRDTAPHAETVVRGRSCDRPRTTEEKKERDKNQKLSETCTSSVPGAAIGTVVPLTGLPSTVREALPVRVASIT